MSEETAIEKRHAENPYTKGKGVVIADLILDGLDNDEVRDKWVAEGYETLFGSGISKDDIYNARSKLKGLGLLDAITSRPRVVKNNSTPPLSVSQPIVFPPPTTEPKPIFDHPEWDKLTFAETDAILDPALKMRILEYKSDKRRAAAEARGDFVTQDQMNALSGRITGVDEKLNSILSALQSAAEEEPEVKTPKKTQKPRKPKAEPEEEEEYEGEEEETQVETANSLDSDAQLDEFIEEPEGKRSAKGLLTTSVEGQLLSERRIGFTSKTMMLYDIVRRKGFTGNFADFVNSCVSRAFKGSKFKLVYSEDEELN